MNSSPMNSTDITCKKKSFDLSLLYTILTTFFSLFAILGIFGNLFVMLLAAKYTVRKNLHYLIINMALVDTLSIFSNITFWIPSKSEQNLWNTLDLPIARFLCKCVIFLTSGFAFESLITLLIISVERFRATRQTLQRTRSYTLRKRIVIITVSWLVSFVIPSYTAFTLEIKTIRDFRTCKYKNKHQVWFVFLYFLTACLLFFVSLALNIATLRSLTRPRAIQASLSDSQIQERARRTAKIVKMVMSSLALYGFCFLPHYVIYVYLSEIWLKDNITCNKLTFLMQWMTLFLSILNSSFSPYIYIAFLSDFQEAARRLLCGRSPDQHKGRNSIEPQHMETAM